MSIFDCFGQDPGHTWAKATKQQLSLDLHQGSLNNITLGDPLTCLKGFGKPDNEQAEKDGYFIYSKSGLIIGTQNQQINSFGIIISKHPHYESFSAADLTITHPHFGLFRVNNGMLRSSTREELIKTLNLQVWETDADDIEIMDYAYISQLLIVIDSFRDGRVKRINIDQKIIQ